MPMPMPIFASAYRPTKHAQTFLAWQQKLESKKRKRGDDPDDEDRSSSPEPDLSLSASFHPLNNTDPYHVASYSREKQLPSEPFPHKATKEASKSRVSIEEELAGLNPPLHVLNKDVDDKSTSFKRRHLDNVTTILHRCMLKGDWQRASRAWALLIRTEIAGRGIDVRRNGRWGIGAELLMRRGAHDNPSRIGDSDESSADSENPQFSNEGFKLAREYYERLIHQYPHTPNTRNSFNAVVVYPALFNIWIYEVQDRFKRAWQNFTSAASSRVENGSDSGNESTSTKSQISQLSHIRSDELDQAQPIAQRMDELLLSPPYDTTVSLLQLRGMVALWISGIHDELARLSVEAIEASDDLDSSPQNGTTGYRRSEQHKARAREGREKATKLFDGLQASGVDLPREALDFLSIAPF